MEVKVSEDGANVNRVLHAVEQARREFGVRLAEGVIDWMRVFWGYKLYLSFLGFGPVGVPQAPICRLPRGPLELRNEPHNGRVHPRGLGRSRLVFRGHHTQLGLLPGSHDA